MSPLSRRVPVKWPALCDACSSASTSAASDKRRTKDLKRDLMRVLSNKSSPLCNEGQGTQVTRERAYRQEPRGRPVLS